MTSGSKSEMQADCKLKRVLKVETQTKTSCRLRKEKQYISSAKLPKSFSVKGMEGPICTICCCLEPWLCSFLQH